MKYGESSHAVGIDISDGSLELANIQERRDGVPVLIDYARVTLPEHVIVHGRIQDEPLLDEALEELLDQTSLELRNVSVCTALPDSQIITKILPLPKSPEIPSFDSLHQSAQLLYKSLNFRIEDPVLQWTFHELPDTSGELTLFATAADAVHQWERFFKKEGMDLLSLEMESLALQRAFIQKIPHNESIALIDFGFRMTIISIVDASGLRYSHTIDQGGFDLTTAIARTTSAKLDTAERLKISVGLTNRADKPLHALITKNIDDLLHLIHASLQDFGGAVDSIIITGGGARLRGIRAETEHVLKIPTKRGIPWFSQVHQVKGQLNSTQIETTKMPLYAGALGLALRGMNRYTLAKGINFIDE